MVAGDGRRRRSVDRSRFFLPLMSVRDLSRFRRSAKMVDLGFRRESAEEPVTHGVPQRLTRARVAAVDLEPVQVDLPSKKPMDDHAANRFPAAEVFANKINGVGGHTDFINMRLKTF